MRWTAAPAGSVRFLTLLAAAGLVACGSGAEEGSEPSADGPGAAEVHDYAALPNPFGERIERWGELPGDREWGRVSGVHGDPDGGHVWVAERCGGNSCVGSGVAPVLKLDAEGNVVAAFGAGLFVRPHGVFVDGDGNVWVTDDQGASEEELERHPEAAGIGHRTIKFSPEGEILMTLGEAGQAGDPPDRLTRPADVVVGPEGFVYVAEGHSSEENPARISKFTADGEFVTSWGELGSGPGQFRSAHALAFDAQGRLWVADRGNDRVQVFDRDGGFIAEHRDFGRPNDVVVEGDRVYVVDAQSDEERNPGMRRGVYIGDVATGEVTAFLPADPSYNPGGSEGLALDAEGNLYVGEIGVPGMTKYVRREEGGGAGNGAASAGGPGDGASSAGGPAAPEGQDAPFGSGPREGQRVVLITGSNSGLGREVALRLGRAGDHVVVHGRNRERGREVVRLIDEEGPGSARFYRADLGSLAEARELAGAIRRDYDRLEVLVNNAGIYLTPEGRILSEDGHELRFQVNYLSHFLLTRELLPLLEASAPSRIVNVASIAQDPIDFDDVMLEEGYSEGRAYGQSKLAMIMFTFSLDERLEGTGVTVNALHPATLMNTPMVEEAGARPRSTVDEGARAVLQLVNDDVGSGRYFNRMEPDRAHEQAYDEEARRRLWALSEKLAGPE